ncbi:hypothetical protein ACFL2G_00720 [Candidatus Omnitrophota bacterium]
MMGIEKGYNWKVMPVLLAIVVLYANILYSAPEFNLRPLLTFSMEGDNERNEEEKLFIQLVGESPVLMDVGTDRASFLFKVNKILPKSKLYGIDKHSISEKIKIEAAGHGIALTDRRDYEDLLGAPDQKDKYDVVTLIAPMSFCQMLWMKPLSKASFQVPFKQLSPQVFQIP